MTSTPIDAILLPLEKPNYYQLLSTKDASGLPPAVIEKMAEKVTITGKVYSQGGSQFLTVESIK